MGNLLARKAFSIFNGLAPKIGPKSLPMKWDFSQNQQHVFDLYREETEGEIDLIQGIFVDNLDNAQSITFVFSGTGQRLVVPANCQGMFPILSASQLKCTVTSTGAVTVSWQLLNVPVAYTIWGPVTVNIAANNQTFNFTPQSAVAADKSGIVGTNSAMLFAANPAAKRRLLQLPSNAPGSVFVNFGGVAATPAPPSQEILPGATLDTTLGPIDQTQWTIIAAVANTSYTAKEYA